MFRLLVLGSPYFLMKQIAGGTRSRTGEKGGDAEPGSGLEEEGWQKRTMPRRPCGRLFD